MTPAYGPHHRRPGHPRTTGTHTTDRAASDPDGFRQSTGHRSCDPPWHRRPADPSSPPDSRRSRRQAGEHGGRPAGRRPRGARGRLPAARKGGSRVLL